MSELPETQNIPTTVVASNDETKISDTFIKHFWSIVDKIKSNKLYLGLTIGLLLVVGYILYKKYAKSKKQPVIIENDQIQQQIPQQQMVQQQMVQQQVPQQQVPGMVQQQVVEQQVPGMVQKQVQQQVPEMVQQEQVIQQQVESSQEEQVIKKPNKQKKLKKVDSNIKINNSEVINYSNDTSEVSEESEESSDNQSDILDDSNENSVSEKESEKDGNKLTSNEIEDIERQLEELNSKTMSNSN